MKRIVIYGSKYGSTKKYAEEFGRIKSIEVRSYEDIDDINQYDSIIYFGALYAGGVLGMKDTLKTLDINNKELIIVTVGLADPEDKTNINNIETVMKNQLPKEIFENCRIYHLRGSIDYSKLNFKHKTMMALLYKKAKTIPDDKKNAEVRAMIDTYNKKVDFVDFKTLEKIIID